MQTVSFTQNNQVFYFSDNYDIEKTKDDLIREISAKIFAGEEHVEASSIPFRLIRYLSKNDIWNLFVQALNKNLKFGDNKGFQLTTSCVNTAKILSAIIDKDGQWTKSLRHTSDFEFYSQVSTTNKYSITLLNLFDGPIVYNINIDSDEYYQLSLEQRTKKIKTEYLSEHLNEYEKYLRPIVYESRILMSEEAAITRLNKFYAEEIDYSFNQSAISTLKWDLDETSNSTGDSLSWFYVIGSLWHNKGSVEFEHAFVLEQFFCEKYQSVRIRIYQSWIHCATLGDDLNKRSYDTNGEGSWDKQQLEIFLNNLEAHYCRKRHQMESVGSLECFGYESVGGEVPLLNFDGKVLSGLTLRYFCVPIDPGKYVENFVDFMSANQLNLSDVS